MRSRYEQFLVSITSIYRLVEKIEQDGMERYGCKGLFARYLSALSNHPYGLTAAQLAEICDRDKAAVSRMLAEMEQKGLIKRESGRESVYRARILLTEKGAEAAEFVRRQAERLTEAAGKGMSEEARVRIYEWMELINTNLEMIQREGLPMEEEGCGSEAADSVSGASECASMPMR